MNVDEAKDTRSYVQQHRDLEDEVLRLNNALKASHRDGLHLAQQCGDLQTQVEKRDVWINRLTDSIARLSAHVAHRERS